MTRRKNLADDLAGKYGSKSSFFDDDWSGLGSHKSASHGHTKHVSCYHSHPALKLPGTDLVIHGGSCISPAVKDADVYVGFDHDMRFEGNAYPWEEKVQFLFPITDMSVPRSVADFKKLIEWLRAQLEAGKKVHCGCIGGHGRTGTVFAALVSTFGEPDAINYVREHYCHKAVESAEQVTFLGKHFGVLPAKGHKEHSPSSSSSHKSSKSDIVAFEKRSIYSPLVGSKSIWDR